MTDPEQLLRLVATTEHDDMMESKVLATMPEWDRYERGGVLPAGSARLLAQLHGDVSSTKVWLSPELVALIPVVLANVAADIHPSQYVLTLISESCRSDSSIWDILVATLCKQPNEVFTAFTILLGRPNVDTYTSDKAVQVLTALMSHSRVFSMSQVKLVCTNLVSGQFKASPVGVLDGFSNLLKQDLFRQPLFEVFGTLERILAVSIESPPALYRSMFCLWVASFNDAVLLSTFASKADSIVALLKSTFQECRVEKILRMALAVVKNLLAASTIAEAMVESGILHAIQPLEYEKWRDADLYEDIRSVAGRVATETSKHSNFERYAKELGTGQLKWGFIHSEKFWLENVANFERDSFAPVAQLVALLNAVEDPTTQAVACHDLGEFARLHPTGKRIINKLNGKTSVMNLMTNPNREVAKEALLCTQKIMLNQWQKAAKTK